NNIVDSDDVRMIAEASHGMRFAPNAGASAFVEAFGLDLRDGNETAQALITTFVYAFTRPLPQHGTDLVAPRAERRSRRQRPAGIGGLRGRCGRTTGRAEPCRRGQHHATPRTGSRQGCAACTAEARVLRRLVFASSAASHTTLTLPQRLSNVQGR